MEYGPIPLSLQTGVSVPRLIHSASDAPPVLLPPSGDPREPSDAL